MSVGEFSIVEGLDLLAAMKGHFDTRPAFPRLHSLALDLNSLSTFKYWTLFCQPNLGILVDTYNCREMTPSVNLTDFLLLLSGSANGLKEISLDRAVLVDTAGFFVLSWLPHLKKLRLILTATGVPPECEAIFTAGVSMFRQLQDLDIVIRALGIPTASENYMVPELVMWLFSSSPLKRLALTWSGHAPTEDTLLALLSSVARLHRTLETCSLRITCDTTQDRDSEKIALSALLAPLCALAYFLLLLCNTVPPRSITSTAYYGALCA